MKRDEIQQWLEEQGETVLLADGFDEALIGVGRQFSSPCAAVYDQTKCIEILTGQGMSHEEGQEYFDFNVIGSYVGDQTPVFVIKLGE